jgi:hypothetical protein
MSPSNLLLGRSQRVTAERRPVAEDQEQKRCFVKRLGVNGFYVGRCDVSTSDVVTLRRCDVVTWDAPMSGQAETGRKNRT